MKRMMLFAGVLIVCALSTISAHATVLRAFVSSTGNDTNAATNCAQTAPCRTFAGALPVVTPGGELIALDTSGYGPLTGASTIGKAITIAAVPGARAFVIVASGAVGFTVGAGSNDLIILRNINFNGTNASTTIGVLLNTGKLVIDNCDFTQMTTAGLRVLSGITFVRNSSFTGNSGRGIYASTTGRVEAEQIVVSHNGTGITVDGNCNSTYVHVDSGSIVGNTLGFEMLNAVCSPNAGVLPQNIFLRNDGGQRVNVAGNTTNTGPSPGAGNSANVGTYQTALGTTY